MNRYLFLNDNRWWHRTPLDKIPFENEIRKITLNFSEKFGMFNKYFNYEISILSFNEDKHMSFKLNFIEHIFKIYYFIDFDNDYQHIENIDASFISIDENMIHSIPDFEMIDDDLVTQLLVMYK